MKASRRVIMIAAECTPFAHAGGLGDVVGALPVELEKLGAHVTIVMPRHRVIDLQKFGFRPQLSLSGTIPFGFEQLSYDVHQGVLPGSTVQVFLVGNDRFFDRNGIYFDPASGKDYPDQADRWIVFNRAAIALIQQNFADVDVVHCHDYQAALVPAYLRKFFGYDAAIGKISTLFTIHNLGYQGLFGRDVMWKSGFNDSEFYPTSPFEFYGMFNFMKVGISYADMVSTVSPTYAQEIQQSREYGNGLEGVLRVRSADLVGILNGIDTRAWDPATDPLIPARFTASNLAAKVENKSELLREFGLDDSRPDVPVFAMISRIDVQKGFDLLLTILDYLLSKDVFFVLLGTGNKETEHYLQTVVERHRGKASIRFQFEYRLAHLVEAGADIFLMPSKYEPCGLNQMYSQRYGTAPIVRATGGLNDTVTEFDSFTGAGTGFRFYDYDPEQFQDAIDRALSIWPDRGLWQKLMRNGMAQDFSWRPSATQYIEIYDRIVSMRRG